MSSIRRLFTSRFHEAVEPNAALRHTRTAQPVIEDWSRVVSFRPRLYHKPQSIDQVKRFLEAVHHGSLGVSHVRTLGSLHSCAEICADDAVLDLSDLPVQLNFSPGDSTVTASAHCTLHHFLHECSLRGKSLLATGGTDAQALAGIISTNTAPATPSRSVYDLLDWAEFIAVDPATGAAVKRRIQRGDANFPAVVGSLGALGVISQVQFRLVDQPYFEVEMKVIPLAEVLDDLDTTSTRYDFWRVNWLPKSNQGLLWRAKQVPPDQAAPEGDYEEDGAENLLKFVFMLWDQVGQGAAGPLLDPVMATVYRLMAAFYNLNPVRASGPLRNMLPVDRRAPLHVAMAEWAFRPTDLTRVMRVCRDYFRGKGWPNIPTEIELTKTDQFYMSPWNWPGLNYIVKFNFMYLTEVCLTPAEMQLIFTHLRGLWDRLVAEGIPFKPHWGKINFMDHAFVAQEFNLAAFKPLVQPMFLNPYLRARLF